MKGFTEEEVEVCLPGLLEKYGNNYLMVRGTEYLDGYDATYLFGQDDDGWSKERVTVRYYY